MSTTASVEPVVEPEVRDDVKTPDETPKYDQPLSGVCFCAAELAHAAWDAMCNATGGRGSEPRAYTGVRAMCETLAVMLEDAYERASDLEHQAGIVERAEAAKPPSGDVAQADRRAALNAVNVELLRRPTTFLQRNLERDVYRLRAAGALIAAGEPDESRSMNGCDAIAVENIVAQIADRLEAYRQVIGEVQQSGGVPKPTKAAEPTPTNGDPESAEDFGPEWSDARWPSFQKAVAALPGFRDGREFQNVLDHFVQGVDDMFLNPRSYDAAGRDETEDDWLEKRCRFVADHCVPMAENAGPA